MQAEVGKLRLLPNLTGDHAVRRLLNLPLTLALPLVVGACATSHQAPESAPAYHPPPDALPRLAQSLGTHRAAAIGVGVIRRGQLVWQGVTGEAAPGTPATVDTLFNVASLAKPVTAEVALRLVEAGRISLDEPMSAAWIDPDLAADPRHSAFTPRRALSHQLGLPNWRGDRKDGKLAFIAEPASGFTYSGEGYEYLRRFMEKKTGQPFESLATQTVFAPLGMSGTTFTANQRFTQRLAQPMNKEGQFRPADLQPEGKPNAADNLFVTLADYARLMIAVAHGDGLGTALATERMRSQVVMPAPGSCEPAPQPGCPTVSEFGLGWVLYRFGPQTIVSNSGMDWGEFALVYFDAASGDGMVYLVNGGNGVPVVMEAMEMFDPASPVLAFGRAQMRPR